MPIIQQYKLTQMRIIQQYFRRNVDLEPWFLYELLNDYRDNLILYQHLSLDNGFKVRSSNVCSKFVSRFPKISALPLKSDYGTDAIHLDSREENIMGAYQMKHYSKTSRITYKHMCSFICHGRLLGASSLALYCLPESRICHMAEYLLRENQVKIIRRSMNDLIKSKKIQQIATLNDLL